MSEGFVDLVFELLRGEGLGEVVVDAGAHRGDNALLVVDGGDHEDGQSGARLGPPRIFSSNW